MSNAIDHTLHAPKDNLRTRVASGVAFVAAGQAVKVAVQFVSVITLSRLLTPSDFGVMAMIAPLVTFISLFQGMGLGAATANAPEITRAQLSTLFWINAVLSLLLAILVACSAPLVGAFYHDGAVVGPMTALAGMVLISGLAAQHVALANRQMHFRGVAMVEVAASILALCAAVAVALIRPSVWALVTSVMVSAFVSLVGVWCVTRWRPGRPSGIRTVGSFLHFGRGMMGFNVANFLARNLDNVLIGRYAGAMELGFYDRAYKLLLFPLQQINGPVSRVVTPVLSRLANDPERYRAAYTRVVQLMLLVTVPGVVWLLVNAATAIPIILGEQWRDTVPIFIWLGIAALHQPMTATVGWLFISQRRTDELAAWGVFVAVTCIASFVIGLQWGALGVAAAYALGDVLLRLPLVLWLVGRKGPVSTRMLCALALPYLVSNGVAATVLLALPQDIGLAPLPDIAVRAACSYATCWSVLLLFPSGRRTFAEALKTLRGLLRLSPARPSGETSG